MESSRNITWQSSNITRKEREQRYGQRSVVIWLTGLSGSGKSTIAFALEKELFAHERACYVLDGDNIRHGLNRDLGFSEQDRKENLRRIGEVAKLFMDAGSIVIAAFISPHAQDRQMVRDLFEEGDFIEVYIDCSLSACEERDPKGLYKKARAGEIPNFTGVSAPYEAPQQPELTIDTEHESVEQCVAKVIAELERRADQTL
ncbi:adenylyl-sulfate kinase [Paenibacillus sp. CFBP13512]|uniref:adenylyl-sulfate kinase n=1 Tax=Paenibacillus TaxID=44249 RepID=UPI0010C03975|nr:MULTISPECIES: adenylyl-sulfate kinase [Paenibacillus]TKJ93457.1 adenylyl-sulfate kinase [Paenibacillus sp. CFBP13512]CAJ1316423.1 Adenylyl-sulfate kinase [Paenibacillus nuruki]